MHVKIISPEQHEINQGEEKAIKNRTNYSEDVVTHFQINDEKDSKRERKG